MRETESLEEYLARLAAADPQRTRLHYDYIDARGNVIVRPVLIMGKDTNDDIRPLKLDTTGRLDVIGVCPEHQADATLSQSSPVSGTQYEVLATNEYVRVIGMVVKITYSVATTALQLHLVIDGQTITFNQNNPNEVNYYPSLRPTPYLATGQDDLERQAFLIEGRSVQVSVESTGGTGTTLTSTIVWAKW